MDRRDWSDSSVYVTIQFMTQLFILSDSVHSSVYVTIQFMTQLFILSDSVHCCLFIFFFFADVLFHLCSILNILNANDILISVSEA